MGVIVLIVACYCMRPQAMHATGAASGAPARLRYKLQYLLKRMPNTFVAHP